MPPKIALLRRPPSNQKQHDESSANIDNNSKKQEQQSPLSTTTVTSSSFPPPPQSLVTVNPQFIHLLVESSTPCFSQEFLDLNLHKELELARVGGDDEYDNGMMMGNTSTGDKNKQEDEQAKAFSLNPANPFSSPRNEPQERRQLEHKYRTISHKISSMILPVIFGVLTKRIGRSSLASLSTKNKTENNNNEDNDNNEEDAILDEIIEPLNESSLVESVDSAVYTLVQDCVAIDFCVEYNFLSLAGHWRINLVSKFCSRQVAKIVEEIEGNVIQKFFVAHHQETNNNNNNNNSSKSESSKDTVRKLKTDLEKLFIRYRRYSGARRQCLRDFQHLLSLCRTTRLQALKNFASGEALLYQVKILEGDVLREQNHLLATAHALHQSLKRLALFVHEKFHYFPKKRDGKDDDDDNNDQKDYTRVSQLPFTPAEIDRLVGIKSSEVPNQSLITFFPAFEKYQDAMNEAPYRGTAYCRLASLCSRFPVFLVLDADDDKKSIFVAALQQQEEQLVASKENQNMFTLNVCYWYVRGICAPIDSVDLFESSMENLKKIMKQNMTDAKRLANSNNNNTVPLDVELLAISYQIFSNQMKKVLSNHQQNNTQQNKNEEDSNNALNDDMISKWSSRFKQKCLEKLNVFPDKFFLRFTIIFLVLSQGGEKFLVSYFEILLTLFLEKNNHYKNKVIDHQTTHLIESSSSISTSISIIAATLRKLSTSTKNRQKSPSLLLSLLSSTELRSKILAVRDFCDNAQLCSESSQLFEDFENRYSLQERDDENESTTVVNSIITADDREIFGIPKRAENLSSILKKRKEESEQLSRSAIAKNILPTSTQQKVQSSNSQQQQQLVLLKKWLIDSTELAVSSSSSLFATERISVEEYREKLSKEFRVGLHRHDPKFVERSYSAQEDTVCLRLMRLSKNLRKMLLE